MKVTRRDSNHYPYEMDLGHAKSIVFSEENALELLESLVDCLAEQQKQLPPGWSWSGWLEAVGPEPSDHAEMMANGEVEASPGCPPQVARALRLQKRLCAIRERL